MSVPMFPLGTVIFPYTAVPLRVFEPRYQALLDQVLTADRSFGVVMIERGSEVGGGDTRSMIGTMVRLVAVNDLPKTNDRAIVVAGFKRIRLSRWFEDDPFPKAEVEDFPDGGDAGVEGELNLCIDTALISLRRVLALASELGSDVSGIGLELADHPVAASYQLAALCPVGPFDLQRLLEATDAVARVDLARMLLDDRVEMLIRELSSS